LISIFTCVRFLIISIVILSTVRLSLYALSLPFPCLHPFRILTLPLPRPKHPVIFLDHVAQSFRYKQNICKIYWALLPWCYIISDIHWLSATTYRQ